MADDERPGGPAVAVLGFDLWQSGFGADTAIVGKTIRLGGVQHAVVGVMPPEFRFPIDEQLWTPMRIPGFDLGPDGGPRVGLAFGRLAPGVTLEQAEAESTSPRRALTRRIRGLYRRALGPRVCAVCNIQGTGLNRLRSSAGGRRPGEGSLVTLQH